METHYEIKWKDWDEKTNTWEPFCRLKDKIPEMIENFEYNRYEHDLKIDIRKKN